MLTCIPWNFLEHFIRLCGYDVLPPKQLRCSLSESKDSCSHEVVVVVVVRSGQMSDVWKAEPRERES